MKLAEYVAELSTVYEYLKGLDLRHTTSELTIPAAITKIEDLMFTAERLNLHAMRQVIKELYVELIMAQNNGCLYTPVFYFKILKFIEQDLLFARCYQEL